MTTLSTDQVRTIQSLLDSREAELREDVRSMRAARAERASGSEGRQVEDLVETAEQRLRHGLEHMDLERDQLELRAINEARERLADGSFGECLDCGRDIPFERLRAQPSAMRCVACQEKYERTHQTTPRFTA